ncbi:MAG: TIM barrel protein [Rectinemataceae bacterium]|nr:TIM barrel protein [Rectinemataceae bacterium]
MDIRWAKRVGSAAPEIAEAKAQGFDSVEPSLSALMELDEAGFADFGESLKAAKLSCEVFASILPAEVRVTERGFNIYSWAEYLRLALARASKLGCKTLLWDDGAARILPTEGETSILKEHFNQFLFMLCDIGEQYGIRVCLEPLGPRRTNFLNSLPEVLEAMDSVGKPNLAMGLSSAAVAEIGIPDEELLQFAKHIVHARIEKPRGLAAGIDRDLGCLPFFDSLKKIAYRGEIALPKGSDSDTLITCKGLWKQE